MKKNVLLIFIFIFGLFFSISDAKALDDSGFVVCNYPVSITVDGKVLKFDARIGVANTTNQSTFYYVVGGVQHKINSLDDKTLSAFHTVHSNVYSCPQVRFVHMSTTIEDQANGIKADTSTGSHDYRDATYAPVYHFAVVTSTVYNNNSKYQDKPVSELLTANESMSTKGDNVEAEKHCAWNIDKIVSYVNINTGVVWNADIISPNDEKYMTCYTVSNESLVDKIVAAFNFMKSNKDDYSDVVENGDVDCVALLGDENVKLISTCFFVISMVGILLLVFLVSSDFIKAIASSDDDENKKAFKNFRTRLVSAIILLLLPFLVNFILNFADNNLHFETVNSSGEKSGETSIKVGNVSDCGFTDVSSSTGSSSSKNSSSVGTRHKNGDNGNVKGQVNRMVK